MHMAPRAAAWVAWAVWTCNTGNLLVTVKRERTSVRSFFGAPCVSTRRRARSASRHATASKMPLGARSHRCLVAQAFSPSGPVTSGFKISIPHGYESSARGVMQLAMRFQLTVERPNVISHLFTLAIECPAIEGLFCREPPYCLARSPDDQRSSNRVAHALDLVFCKPTHASVRSDMRLADADLARFFLNRYFFSIGERNLCGACSSCRDSHSKSFRRSNLAMLPLGLL